MRLLSLSRVGIVLMVALSLAGFGGGCGKKSSDGAAAKVEAPASEHYYDPAAASEEPAAKQDKQAGVPAGQPAQKPDGQKKGAAEIERKVIYTATLSLFVEDFDRAQEELRDLIKKSDGLVEQSDIQGKRGTPRVSTWKIRVPVKGLEDFRADVMKLGEPEKNSLSSREVTNEYYDTEAAISNKESLVKTLWDIRDKNAKTVEEVMSVQSKILAVQGEVDQLKGQLKRLQNLTTLTTVDVTLYERKGYVPPQAASFGTTLGRTFEGSVNALVSYGQALVLVGAALTPWLPLLAVLGAVVWWRFRGTRRARTVTSPPAAGPG
jgi:hypothetical protein